MSKNDGIASTFRRLEFRDVIKRIEEEYAEQHLTMEEE